MTAVTQGQVWRLEGNMTGLGAAQGIQVGFGSSQIVI